MRTTLLVCLLYMMSPLAWGDGRSRPLCASAMVYFNPQERSPDPRSLTAVFHHLNILETHVLQLGQPDLLTQPVRAMKGLFAELDRLPRAQRERYPERVRQLLVAHRQLQQALDAAIEQRFDGLLAGHSVRAELQQDKGRTQGGAEFYLSRAMLDPDELAMTVLGEQSWTQSPSIKPINA
jgi:hypothetical protein